MRAALALVFLLAGCAAPDAAPEPQPAERSSFFHSAMTLADAAEANESVVRTGGFYEAWAAGDDHPTWVADPLGHDALVTAATVTLALQTTGPVVESRRFPDIMVYAGSGEAWVGFGSRTDLVAFQPGQRYEVEVELAFPAGGMWLPADAGFGLKVVPVMLQQDERADVEILLGGAEGSRVAWRTEPTIIGYAELVRGEATGEVIGTMYAGAAAPPTTSQRTPLPLDARARFVMAWMNVTASVGIPDVDLAIVGPDGEEIASSGTPTPRDAVRIAGPNLAGAGEYGLVVTTAGAPRASYELEWLIGRA